MQGLTGYHALMHELQNDIIKHGWGEIVFRVASLKDNRVKVEVRSGKTYVFLLEREIKIESDML